MPRCTNILTALLLAAAPCVLSANVVVQPRINGVNACGVVLDPDGRPIPGVSVVMRPRGMNPVASVTDSRGHFESLAFQGSNVEVIVTMSGFAPLYFHADHITRGSCHKGVYVMLAIGEDNSLVALKRSDLPKAKR